MESLILVHVSAKNDVNDSVEDALVHVGCDNCHVCVSCHIWKTDLRNI